MQAKEQDDRRKFRANYRLISSDSGVEELVGAMEISEKKFPFDLLYVHHWMLNPCYATPALHKTQLHSVVNATVHTQRVITASQPVNRYMKPFISISNVDSR